MKNIKVRPLVAATLLALGATSAHAADRYVIQVDNAGKGVVKALAKQLGGDVMVDADGFIAVQFEGKSLDDVKGVMNNPHVKLVEVDQIRKPLGIYNDDVGNPMTQQITPYAYYQSQADQVTFNPNAGMKLTFRTHFRNKFVGSDALDSQ